jgi:hypothetical protein
MLLRGAERTEGEAVRQPGLFEKFGMSALSVRLAGLRPNVCPDTERKGLFHKTIACLVYTGKARQGSCPSTRTSKTYD